MALGDAYKTGRDFIANALTIAIEGVVPWIKGPLAWATTKTIEWIMNIIARPLYEFLQRKQMEKPINKDIDQKIEAVKTAKTETEINHAIDNMP